MWQRVANAHSKKKKKADCGLVFWVTVGGAVSELIYRNVPVRIQSERKEEEEDGSKV